MSLMDQRSHETRQRLIDAARQGFLVHGYEATSTADILRVARVQRGTLYHHFKDKAALLEAVARQLQGEALLAIVDACHDQPAGTLLTGCLVRLDWLSSPGHAPLLLREAPVFLSAPVLEELCDAGFRGWLQQRLLEDIEAGRFEIAGRPEGAARMLEGALAGLAGTEKKGRERLVRDLLARFARTPGNDYLKLLASARGTS